MPGLSELAPIRIDRLMTMDYGLTPSNIHAELQKKMENRNGMQKCQRETNQLVSLIFMFYVFCDKAYSHSHYM